MTTHLAKAKFRFRLRTILLFVNLTVLLLPLAGLFFFRFYENALVQQTEAELIAQSAVIAAVYKQEVLNAVGGDVNLFGVEADPQSLVREDDYYTPVYPQIDLSRAELLPKRPDGETAKQADPRLLQVGKSLLPILEDAKRTTLSGARVLDFRGVVIAGKEEIGQDFSNIPEVSNALKGYYTSVIRLRISDSPPPALASISRGTGIRIFAAFPVIHEGRVWGVVYMSRTPQNILKYLHAEKDKVILAALVLVLITFTIALLTSYMIVRPMNALIKRIREFSAGDIKAMERFSISGVREVETLAQSFSDMALSLHNRSEYIRTFATHVSHEFKTPMTSIQGAAELLLDHMDEMEQERKHKFLSNIVADSERLKRLVNRLLEMAKADNIEVNEEHSDLYLALKKIQGRYKDLGLNIIIEPFEAQNIKIAAEHLETIFVNMFDNAIQHEANEVNILVMDKGDQISILICDNGAGISEGNKAKIFEPFFTTKRKDGGTGLGLGIVQSLLGTHGASIHILDSDAGAKFEIEFPKI